MSGGDDKARFDSVVVPHLAEAFALARWLTGNRADAEDIVQDACLRAYRAVNTFSGGSSRAWLLAIVRNEAYTALRKKNSVVFLPIDELNANDRAAIDHGGGFGCSSNSTPEHELLAKADAAQLETAISALPVEFREPLVLRDIQGLEYREIAQVTAVPVGTVMSRLARARRRVIAMIHAQE
jgi:RNA polymerase sigma-70 factor (ECF subfamily)